MATTTTTKPTPNETTFRAFTIHQGTNYAQHRKNYHPDLYKLILDHHRATGGDFSTLVDVGCGPGIVTRSLAPHFKRAIGVDASPGMVAAARSLNPDIQFENVPIEQLGQVNNDDTHLIGQPIRDGTVDLLTSASAVHWFDMAIFWQTAARLLKPGGSVALFANVNFVVDPTLNTHIQATHSTFVKIQEALDRLFVNLDPYMAPGNRILLNHYRDLYLPWTLPDTDASQKALLDQFDEASFFRKEWTGHLDVDGCLFQDMGPQFSLDQLEQLLLTTSPYVRWREAHTDEAGGANDPIKILRKGIEDALKEGSDGKVDPAKTGFNLSLTGPLLIVKKKKD